MRTVCFAFDEASFAKVQGGEVTSSPAAYDPAKHSAL
jgi:hypothetical protein